MSWLRALPVFLLACTSIREDPPLPSPTSPPDPPEGGSSAGGSSEGGRGGGGEGGAGGSPIVVIEPCACAVALIEEDNFDCRNCALDDETQVRPVCNEQLDACRLDAGCAALLGPNFFCTGAVCVGLMDALSSDALERWDAYATCICAVCQGDCVPLSEPSDPECSFAP